MTTEHPAPERICQMIQVITGLEELRADSASREYQDNRLTVRLHPHRNNAVEVKVKTGSGNVPVFAARGNEPGYPTRYNPGRWTLYLTELHQRLTGGQEDERFAPVDDSEVFPDIEPPHQLTQT